MKIKSAVQSLAIALMLLPLTVQAGTAQQRGNDEKSGTPPGEETRSDAKPESAGTAKPASVEDRVRQLELLIEQQQREIQALRAVIEKRGDDGSPAQPGDAAKTASLSTAQPAPDTKQEPKKDDAAAAQKKFEDLYKKFGSLRFSGDIRFRFESFRNQGFDALTEAPDRNRLRIRARLGLDGTIDSHFDWGLRVATGIFTDPITTNQTLTDFYERKTFGLDRAFIRYDSKGEKVGVSLIAGKFEPTFRRTQMVWDDDISVEGASEALYFKTKTPLRQIRLVAFQLPFNELANAKDGVLYGGQIQTDWVFSHVVSASANVAYYDWNHPDGIIPALGAATTQVNGGIQNGAAVTGAQNGALGTTNRIVRNAAGVPIGFLAGFNLVDTYANLVWQASGRFPVTFIFDFVHNATGRVRDEKDGVWLGARVGQTKEKGDWMFEYFYTRIEQDAVLVPFNFSDILASNSRAHMPSVAYQIANNVQLQWTGLFSQRENKVVLTSPFNRYLNRMQFDVIYKF